MTALGIAQAHALIEGELGRIDEADRGKVADQVLGALTSRFMLIPHPSAAAEAATRAEVANLLPGLFTRGGSS